MAEGYNDHFIVDGQLLASRTSPTIVLVAGKTGSGKSTALNNIFGLNFEARSSPGSVTTVIADEVVERNGTTFRVIDTPGLGDAGGRTTATTKAMATAVKSSDFTLLYCLPVKPSDTLTETDKLIIKSLQSHLGRRVWDKCVLLLTYSDIARHGEFPSDHQADSYISYLHEHIQAFHRMLKDCGIDIPPIKSIFAHDRLQFRAGQESTGEIIAVPVMKTNSNAEPKIHPGSHTRWTEKALVEVTHVTRLKRLAGEPDGVCRILTGAIYGCCSTPNVIATAFYRCYKNPRRSTTVVVQGALRYPYRVIVGALLGAGIGCLCGMFRSQLWMVIGTCIGALVGVVLAFLSFLGSKEC